ncbi:YihY/virulence factor BrkB family protein [Phreatobacter sp.]|uniref:YihY/virulence factor BrkB family protein n=1 Tax=Phreatobacter sp. TaxID=1966341 RepID=UPI0022CADFCB|nr:YihY/virulence factor BrkB family protein [Phreatobacter sp.]MCZ8314175.1 YihY/virulence factor BrkB family protein [Phreatobacter sp.]
MLMPFRVAWEAFEHFLEDDGWAISSHIALNGLMSLFPFLILVTALASFAGARPYSEEVTRILLEAWPEVVARPIAREIETVLTTTRTDLLTIGALLAVYFASNGVEALRAGLNRAYEVREMRWWYLCRLESIAYVLIGAVALLITAVLVVLGPLIWATAVRIVPWLAPFGWVVLFLRVAAASVVIVIALTVVHLLLPAGRRSFIDVLPGIVATLVLWLLGGTIFGSYLAHFAQNYVNTYAGLASVMVTLVFLYYSAAIFVLGGELNAAIWRARGRIF